MQLAIAVHNDTAGENTLSWPIGEDRFVDYKFRYRVKREDGTLSDYQSLPAKKDETKNRFIVDFKGVAHNQSIEYQIDCLHNHIDFSKSDWMTNL